MKPLDVKSWNIETSLPRLTAFVMGDELAHLADQREDIVALTADLMFSNGLNIFQERHPSRFFNMGIAEQNMISAAAGLASCGLIPYVSTFASFASLLCAEQIRTDLAYPQMPVRVMAHHAGIAMGFYGTSHHAVEDLALMRAIADLTVVAPCDALSIRAILRSTIDLKGPVYIRLGRGVEAAVYDSVPIFEYGRFSTVREGSDATVIAVGIGVKNALLASEVLRTQGISIRVVDAVYVKPIDVTTILTAARETGGILTVEEHNPNGGLGGAVAEILAEAGIATRFRRHSLPDDYALVAPPTHLYRHYGLDRNGIVEAVKSLLSSPT